MNKSILNPNSSALTPNSNSKTGTETSTSTSADVASKSNEKGWVYEKPTEYERELRERSILGYKVDPYGGGKYY